MDQVKFMEDFLLLADRTHFKCFKGRLLKILLGPFLNTLTNCPINQSPSNYQ